MSTENNISQQIRNCIIGWERLRIVFNLTLLGFGLLFSWDLHSDFGGVGGYMFCVVVYGITVNAFYCLGPLAEIYLLSFVPSRTPSTRIYAFTAGTVFSMAVTFILALGTRQSFLIQGVIDSM